MMGCDGPALLSPFGLPLLKEGEASPPRHPGIPRSRHFVCSCPFRRAKGAGSSYALRKAGDAMKARMGLVMLAIAEVIRAVSLVVKWAMAPPMVQPMGIMPMAMV